MAQRTSQKHLVHFFFYSSSKAICFVHRPPMIPCTVLWGDLESDARLTGHRSSTAFLRSDPLKTFPVYEEVEGLQVLPRSKEFSGKYPTSRGDLLAVAGKKGVVRLFALEGQVMDGRFLLPNRVRLDNPYVPKKQAMFLSGSCGIYVWSSYIAEYGSTGCGCQSCS